MKRFIKQFVFIPVAILGVVITAIYHVALETKAAATSWWLTMRCEMDSVGEVWRKL